MPVNSYFACREEYFFFDDTDTRDTIRAWESAKVLETDVHRMRVWREITSQPHLCRRIVGQVKPLEVTRFSREAGSDPEGFARCLK